MFLMKLWHRFFLEERSSIGLSFFRPFVALTTGLHVMPSFVHLDENYFPTAFKTFNLHFFPLGFVQWIQKSPEWVIVVCVILFCLSCFTFFIGLMSRLSCLIMMVMCYYFYALNSFHVGTLSWDILLVVIFLMCCVPYHGDYFSVDCLIKKDVNAYKRKRPFFVQRLLQLHLGFIFFYTALYKATAKGNWITDNPLYYLMNYPPEGVTKTFLLKDILMTNPQLCYGLGIAICVMEFLMIGLLFWKKTRYHAIYLGCIFHVVLILTLDVPATFFFLFPPMFLLFISPHTIETWIEQKRISYHQAPRHKVIYDGQCVFCRESVKQLRVLDLYGRLDYVDFQTIDLAECHKDLTVDVAKKQLHLINPQGQLSGGFYAFRKMAWLLPMMWPVIPLLYLPGMGWIGSWAYRLIAKNRYLLMGRLKCDSGACRI